MKCHVCGQALTRDEIGLSKKLINRGTNFHVPEDTLRQMIERFREAGCSLFR